VRLLAQKGALAVMWPSRPIALAVALSALACSEEHAQEVRRNVSAAASTAIEDLRECTYEQREAVKQALADSIARIERETESLRAWARQQGDSVRADAADWIRALEERSADAHKKLEALERSSRETWDTLVAEARAAAERAQQALDRALER
jgi:hypothetical protein